jgi:hypothetical protein
VKTLSKLELQQFKRKERKEAQRKEVEAQRLNLKHAQQKNEGEELKKYVADAKKLQMKKATSDVV